MKYCKNDGFRSNDVLNDRLVVILTKNIPTSLMCMCAYYVDVSEVPFKCLLMYLSNYLSRNPIFMIAIARIRKLRIIDFNSLKDSPTKGCVTLDSFPFFI